MLRELSTAERSRLYRILESSMLADVFEYLEEEETVQYLEEMDVKKAAAILSKMETDALADVLKQIDKEKRKLLIQLLDEQVRKDIEMIRSFDEDEIGSRMTTNCIVIRENLTVKQAMSELVSQAADNDNICSDGQRGVLWSSRSEGPDHSKTGPSYGRADRNFLSICVWY